MFRWTPDRAHISLVGLEWVNVRRKVIIAMKFGVFLLNEKPPQTSDEEVTDNALEQSVMADEWGFDALFLGEHHFSPYGTMADTMVFGGAVAVQTKRIMISNAVLVPSFVHPVRVAEQIAMVDVMSHGRYAPGFGRGYQSREFRGYGVDQNQSTARFREAVKIIDGLLSNETFSYQGQFWSFENLPLTPRPVQRPRPPMYVGAIKTQESVEWMVENDYLPMTGNPYSQPNPLEAYSGAAVHDMILDVQRRLGKPETLDDTWGLLHNVVVADSDEEAARVFRESWEFGNELIYTYTKVVEEGETLPDDYKAYAGGMFATLKQYSYDDMLNFPGSLVGSPDTVVEKLKRIHELTGLKNQIMWMNRGGVMKQPDLLRSMELFAKEVLPRVKDLGEQVPAVAGAAAAA
jgi:alkanesulfonate monooxygenase SsuD/methylene tetrahydromethanopterin reductase-like flavin-dependent oxidoreductase (luciferase family)